MKKLSDSKIFWMVISFLISLSVWVYVTSVENVETTKTFQIPVELTGEETLKNMYNLVITDVDTNMVTVVISGPRRIVNSLDDSMLTAQVDVSRITQAAYTSLNYDIIYPSGTESRKLSVVSRSRDTVNFMVSKLSTKTVPVLGGFAGEIAEGYTFKQNEIVFEPNTILLSGPEVYLRNIDHAYVTFGKGLVLSSTYSEPQSFILCDENNTQVDTTEISYSPETVRATLTVYEMRTVSLEINKIFGAGATEENVRVTIEPSNLVLYGDTSDMAGLNQIVLDTIDFTKFGTTFTKTYPISIPNGITNTTGELEATVTIEVLGMQTKTYQVDKEQVTWIGLDDATDVEIVSGSIPVMLRGSDRVIRLLDVKSIRCEIDLSQFQGYRGSVLVPVKVNVVGFDDVGAISEDGVPEYTVLVKLTDKQETEEEAEGEA